MPHALHKDDRMSFQDNGLRFWGTGALQQMMWHGPLETVAFDADSIRARLLNLAAPCYVVRYQNIIGVTHEGGLYPAQPGGVEPLLVAAPVWPQQLGDPYFMSAYGLRYPYAAGAMANGIASERLVIRLGQEQILSSFGAAGLLPARLESAIQQIQAALPHGPYAFNLIHSPSEDALERAGAELYVRHGVTTVEASAYLSLTPHIVAYRAAGLSLNQANQIVIGHRVIAKISRREVAAQFMQPAPANMLRQLVEQGRITELQANLAQHVPMADDITVEADSGGHTDNRPLVGLLPSILAQRNELQARYNYPMPVRVGAAGGISTPASALGAFMMGAAYVVTGSVNQACVEAGTSPATRQLLAQAEMPDVMMAPAADMFEMGVKVQVLKRGVFFPMRAQKLYEIYQSYNSIEEIPPAERDRLEQQIFRRKLDDIWEGTVQYFAERDPSQIHKAQRDPKRKMALIFRWYLGLSSRWANSGEKGREADYQIWCGPSMGVFNEWVRGSYLERPENRSVADVAHHIMLGAAYLYRLQTLRVQGLILPGVYEQYQPYPLTAGR